MTTEPPATIEDAIKVSELTHTYPGSTRPAIDAISFSVRPGEVFGILGPNGGGKTTLFRILATMLQPSAGSASVFGQSAITQPLEVRRSLGVVFQTPSLDLKLTAQENLHHHGRLYGLGNDLPQRIDRWLNRFELTDRRNDRVERLSGGLRRRVELAKALLHDPKLLLMDEPTTGLDPAARRDLWHHLNSLVADHGVTVVLTTHLMDEADRCNQLIILAEGRLIAVDTPTNLKARIGGDVITVEPVNDADDLSTQIAQRFNTRPVIVDGLIRWEQTNGAEQIGAIGAAFHDHIRSITVAQPSLEDVFLQLTGRRFDAGHNDPSLPNA